MGGGKQLWRYAAIVSSVALASGYVWYSWFRERPAQAGGVEQISATVPSIPAMTEQRMVIYPPEQQLHMSSSKSGPVRVAPSPTVVIPDRPASTRGVSNTPPEMPDAISIRDAKGPVTAEQQMTGGGTTKWGGIKVMPAAPVSAGDQPMLLGGSKSKSIVVTPAPVPAEKQQVILSTSKSGILSVTPAPVSAEQQKSIMSSSKTIVIPAVVPPKPNLPVTADQQTIRLGSSKSDGIVVVQPPVTTQPATEPATKPASKPDAH